MTSAAVSALVHLAVSPSPSPSHVGPPDDIVSPGLLGFLSFLFLGVAVFFLARGLSKQLRRVSFDEGPVDTAGGESSPEVSSADDATTPQS